MRVITGTCRACRLLEPEGMDIRPTAGAVKEALFNIIQFDIEGRRVLDLFAGTGQLGIEALSRGAASCVFTDSSRQAVGLVQENLRRCGLQGTVLLCDGWPICGAVDSLIWFSSTRPMARAWTRRRWRPSKRLTSCQRVV